MNMRDRIYFGCEFSSGAGLRHVAAQERGLSNPVAGLTAIGEWFPDAGGIKRIYNLLTFGQKRIYNLVMIVYDEAKRAANLERHGFDFVGSEAIFAGFISIRKAEKHEERIYWKNFPG